MSPKIGVGVEGPGDRAFWSAFLHRMYPDCLFKVCSMNGRPKLIGAASKLLDTFHDLRYAAGIIILDRDKDPCVPALVDLFDRQVQDELERPVSERFLQVCVAVRKIESWFLADQEAVTTVLPNAKYDIEAYTSNWGKRKLGELCKQQYGKTAVYNEPDFGKSIAACFSIERASGRSPSLCIGWERIQEAVSRATETR